MLHGHADGRFPVLRAELISHEPVVMFEVVVQLMQSAASAMGEDLLSFAAGNAAYGVADALIEYAGEGTAEILVLAAANLPDLRRIVHALRRKGFLLEYRSNDAARLLLRQPERSLVFVVSRSAPPTAVSALPAWHGGWRVSPCPGSPTCWKS